MTTKFSEKQLLLSSGLTGILLIAIAAAACLQYYYFSGFDELASLNLLLLIVFYSPFVFLIIWFYYGKMELTVDDSELRIEMWRFSKAIPLRSITSCSIIDVQMMRNFGGMGYRIGEIDEGYVYPGQPKGVLLSHVGGERDIVISSRRPGELLNALCAHGPSRQ